MESVPEAQPISEVGATKDKKDDTVDKLSDLREMYKIMRFSDSLCVSYDRAQEVLLGANKPGEYSAVYTHMMVKQTSAGTT